MISPSTRKSTILAEIVNTAAEPARKLHAAKGSKSRKRPRLSGPSPSQTAPLRLARERRPHS